MNEETHMILRVPQEMAQKINEIIDDQGDEQDFIEITPKVVVNPNGE